MYTLLRALVPPHSEQTEDCRLICSGEGRVGRGVARRGAACVRRPPCLRHERPARLSKLSLKALARTLLALPVRIESSHVSQPRPPAALVPLPLAPHPLQPSWPGFDARCAANSLQWRYPDTASAAKCMESQHPPKHHLVAMLSSTPDFKQRALDWYARCSCQHACTVCATYTHAKQMYVCVCAATAKALSPTKTPSRLSPTQAAQAQTQAEAASDGRRAPQPSDVVQLASSMMDRIVLGGGLPPRSGSARGPAGAAARPSFGTTNKPARPHTAHSTRPISAMRITDDDGARTPLVLRLMCRRI